MHINTHYINLDKKQQKLHTATQIILLFLCIFAFVLFVRELIFPTFTFNFDSSIDSLANTISRPYESKNGTSFHLSNFGESNKIQISLTLPEDMPTLPQDTEILVYKSYLSFLSPESTQKYTDHIAIVFNDDESYFIEKNDTLYPLISKNVYDSYFFKTEATDLTSESLETARSSKEYIGFAPATLISSREGIFVTDGDKKHPVQDERTFQALGYNFDNVISADSAERSLHKDAKMLTIKDAHPHGTIFHANDTNRTFVFDKNTLNKITTTQSAIQHAIVVQELSRTTVASCTLKKSVFPRHYTCTANLDTISDFNGNTYQMTLKDAPNTKIANMQIKLSTTVSRKSLADRIDSIKRKIDTNYN